ncbi:hypothetical protein VPNG_05726 [Cytospora leucostoma]|uniref:Altered inheritance of mitochondria protein 32 n=1 Tax=Cytospora leucostoma TaxID=1230097 RepID=A0A423WZW1_9PEZI|nr:hypothetical protein VPNG_05726 [Cytospora leucostoma]
MSLRLPLQASRQTQRQLALWLKRSYSAIPKAPSFPTVPTCPPSTCECAATPAMPNGLDIDYKGNLNGLISSYREQVLICTGKDDWPSRIEDDNSGDNLAGDLKELFGRGGVYSDPFHNISVLNSSFPPSVPPRTDVVNTSAYLLPSFKYVPFLPRVSFDSVDALAKGYLLPEKLHPMHDGLSPIHRDRLTRKPVYGNLLHGVRDVEDIVVLICGHGGRDMRCGVMGPALRDEFEAQLPRHGVEALHGPVKIDLGNDVEAITGTIEKPALTARVGLISHIGGHKFAGNVIIYLPPAMKAKDGTKHPLAGHGIWYGRVEPKHVQGIIHETIVKGHADHGKAPPTGEGIAPPTRRPSRGRRLVIGTTIISLTLGVLYALIPDTRPTRTKTTSALNDESFREFTVVSNEQVSPTSFILTVKPSPSSDARENAEVMRKAWGHGLWSVEIKQPQLQIARNYTPLPPPPLRDGDESDEDASATTLRFLVRRYEGGEVSKYLSRLRGDVVELRGPHLGFDVAARLGGAGREVVFLAGGTGIAPAMQLARRLLSVPGAGGLSVRIFWANRSALDCVGGPRLEGGQRGRSWWPWSAGKHSSVRDDEISAPGPIVQQLRGLQAAYRETGNRLEFECVVDEEGSRIKAEDITAAVSSPARPSTQSLPAQEREGSTQTVASTQTLSSLSSSSCQLHSQRLLQNTTEDADAQEEKKARESGMRRCNCAADGAAGRNLFMVSGPDGFVGAYVGPKVWAAGAERQGPVGGIVGELVKREPKTWAQWLILKQ